MVESGHGYILSPWMKAASFDVPRCSSTSPDSFFNFGLTGRFGGRHRSKVGLAPRIGLDRRARRLWAGRAAGWSDIDCSFQQGRSSPPRFLTSKDWLESVRQVRTG